jgi:hypothetical protein
MKWLRYQRVISLEKQVRITSQRNKWANMDPRIYWRWDQVPRRSEHPLNKFQGQWTQHTCFDTFIFVSGSTQMKRVHIEILSFPLIFREMVKITGTGTYTSYI